MLNVIQDLTVHDIINILYPCSMPGNLNYVLIILCMSFEIEPSTVAGDHLRIKKIT